MKKTRNHIRRPVRRSRAEYYLLYMLLSFAGAVVETRVFLHLTGYPQLGNKELHIAHVLWGGLALFVAVLVPLIFANRWAYLFCAIMGGIGVGMFIDEVGKFITQSNDYFYPFAAPIIYAFFLLTVVIYLQARRPSSRDPRSEMYTALDEMMEVLDRDLNPQERSELDTRLRSVAGQTQFPDLARLADALLGFLDSDDLVVVEEKPDILERFAANLRKLETVWVSREVHRVSLIMLLGLLGAIGVFELVVSLLIIASPDTLERIAFEIVRDEQRVQGTISLGWYIVRMLLQGIVGLLFGAASVLFVLRHERLAVRIGSIALVLSLTMVNLLLFYFDQFATVTLTVSEFAILIAMIRYRQRFLDLSPADSDD